LKIKTKIVSCHTADSKPVKLEVNSTVILSALVFPGPTIIIMAGVPYHQSDHDIFGQPFVLSAPPILRMIVRLSQEVL
jgi:hypothetical protein